MYQRIVVALVIPQAVGAGGLGNIPFLELIDALILVHGQFFQHGGLDGHIQTLAAHIAEGVDTNDLAVFIHQGAAAVAMGNGSVHLNALNGANAALNGGHTAAGEAAGKSTQSGAHRIHLLAGADFFLRKLQIRRFQIDLQHRQVVDVAVVHNLLHIICTTAGNLHGDIRRHLDHMEIGHNGALIVNKETGAGGHTAGNGLNVHRNGTFLNIFRGENRQGGYIT